jgi:alpha-glucosidase (family GH31 glycosyl hydrolase)
VPRNLNRREMLQAGAVLCSASLLPREGLASDSYSTIARTDIEIQLASVSPHTLRLSILPIKNGTAGAVPSDGSLARTSWGPVAAKLRGEIKPQIIKLGPLSVRVAVDPLTFKIETHTGQPVQTLELAKESGVLSFEIGNSPLLGLGEGGPQFDRRGSVDLMRSGQSGYKLATHGGRVPVPWLIGTAGWAMFIHQPLGTFDFAGSRGRFQPTTPDAPLDLFFIAAAEPATIMSEYARLTGHAEMPPLWSLGYQQSHRTLAGRDEVVAEAKTFRQKKLPCDAFIYLGTGFCPSGWNTQNGSFEWNSRVFPDPQEILDELHKEHFRSVFHVVILADKLRGTAHDRCNLAEFDEQEAGCYWNAHRKNFRMGVDGWWPDEGDALDISSRLVRNRMYWEGPQIDRPNERPYALHRNGYAGMQRYGSFLWSGDVYSTWETLKLQVPIAINTSLTGIPYWGTDIGGFVPTKEFTAELYVRWFQFAAFCTLFRAHGRTWKLRLPWGWNTGDPGPVEISNYEGAAAPDASQLHNAQVEPICRKYLELRYRLLPYLYSAVRECATTGMPIMRALWLHHPNDPKAVACGDEFLWGPSLLVAPVVEKGAMKRLVYLPGGDWFDFWTGQRIQGGREITREVDLGTMPLYARAGSIIPIGPLRQYVDEKVDEPLTIRIYSGNDAAFLLYEDDGRSFNYRQGEWMGIQMTWNNLGRRLSLRLAEGSRMLPPAHRIFDIKLDEVMRQIKFGGQAEEVSF